jgi:hypothetical protein
MALPASGPISISAVNSEFARASNTQTSLSQLYRGGGIVTVNNTEVPASGEIGLGDFYNAAREFYLTISSNQTNADLFALAVAAGWDQFAPLAATIGTGVYVSSDSTSTPALTVSGEFPGGLKLINDGFIIGMGGAGGRGGGLSTVYAGASGGLALSVTAAVLLTNNGTIAGGGGGGGGGRGSRTPSLSYSGGGGGGGRSSLAANSLGGVGPNGADDGGVGTVSAPGLGGDGEATAPNGGNGGNWGSAGSSGGANTVYGPGGVGGAGGAAVSGDSNITWAATGTRLGAVT